MQMVHRVIVKLTNLSLQNPCENVDQKNLLIGRTKTLFVFNCIQSMLMNNVLQNYQHV